jgi:RHS repeat-associated protein
VRNWLGAEQVLTYPQPSIKLTNGTATWLHFDHLGSVRAITDATGAKVESAIYRPFGEQSEGLQPGTPAPETKGWIGERYDADAGLQYLNARYYDPVLSLFLQPDWFEVTKPGVGTNRFSYSFNDPVNKIDPGGNQTNDETMGDEFDSPSCEESGGCDYRLQNWASRIGRNLRAARDNPLEALSGMVRGTVQDLAFGAENVPTWAMPEPVGTMIGAAQAVLDSCKGSSGCNDYVYGEMTDAQQGGYLIGSVATGAVGIAKATAQRAARFTAESLLENGSLRTTKTVAAQLAGERSYIGTESILDAVRHGVRTADPKGVEGFSMYTADASRSFAGSVLDPDFSIGYLEVLVDETRSLVAHVMYKSW